MFTLGPTRRPTILQGFHCGTEVHIVAPLHCAAPETVPTISQSPFSPLHIPILPYRLTPGNSSKKEAAPEEDTISLSAYRFGSLGYFLFPAGISPSCKVPRAAAAVRIKQRHVMLGTARYKAVQILKCMGGQLPAFKAQVGIACTDHLLYREREEDPMSPRPRSQRPQLWRGIANQRWQRISVIIVVVVRNHPQS